MFHQQAKVASAVVTASGPHRTFHLAEADGSSVIAVTAGCEAASRAGSRQSVRLRRGARANFERRAGADGGNSGGTLGAGGLAGGDVDEFLELRTKQRRTRRANSLGAGRLERKSLIHCISSKSRLDFRGKTSWSSPTPRRRNVSSSCISAICRPSPSLPELTGYARRVASPGPAANPSPSRCQASHFVTMFLRTPFPSVSLRTVSGKLLTSSSTNRIRSKGLSSAEYSARSFCFASRPTMPNSL
eukprot:scaffold1130_cov195-Pinguiococcus_pyrenoidosus.AAC.11